MTLTRIRSVDLETVFGPDGDERVCEIGWFDILIHQNGERIFPCLNSEMINPGMPVDPLSRSIHHISDEDLSTASRDAEGALERACAGMDIMVAHNAAFEQRFVRTRAPWICTYKVARRLWPELPSFKLQFLRYHLDLPVDHDKAMPPHRARPDAYVAGMLFARLLDHMPIERMIDISVQPTLLYRCHLKKHKGVLWEDIARIDPGYLQWLLTHDIDDDIMHTASYWLRRAG